MSFSRLAPNASPGSARGRTANAAPPQVRNCPGIFVLPACCNLSRAKGNSSLRFASGSCDFRRPLGMQAEPELCDKQQFDQNVFMRLLRRVSTVDLPGLAPPAIKANGSQCSGLKGHLMSAQGNAVKYFYQQLMTRSPPARRRPPHNPDRGFTTEPGVAVRTAHPRK